MLTDDLGSVWREHVGRVIGDRGDEHRLHGSDLGACGLAVWKRLKGEPMLPPDDDSFANFERGYAYEARVYEALVAYYVPRGYSVTHGEEIEYDGIVGHLDFALYEAHSDTPAVIVDVTTTAGKAAEWSYAHALKTAFYAHAKGAPRFAEWVFRFGFGGKILDQRVYEWALTDESPLAGLSWGDAVVIAVLEKKNLASWPIEPEAAPPYDPRTGQREDWRCRFCRADCVRNERRPR